MVCLLELDLPGYVVSAVTAIAELQQPLTTVEVDGAGLRASTRRQREYIAGRNLVGKLLAVLGQGGQILGSDGNGVPLWPKGITGSISHCRDMVFAAVAETDRITALGVDIEDLGRFHDGLAEVVLTVREQAELPSDEAMRQRQMAITFSAKEAFYKCQFATHAEVLDFLDAEVRIEDEAFHIVMVDQARHGHLAEGVTGRYAVSDAHVATIAWFSAP
ncbi:4'-phosphopantetheinyl transferase superfamily protein [Asticcacaulis sp. BYS171W]|uniref:Enterobactin synthase component D n=1 Tax=Asticcacaulis aquaticus TaxID=2984212 RepID=A0ABT5HUH8_9CAUL|nr:4'-phosphopantetheinyl transferase superfamily protein [Asticcacaulis aquaticus]MDC7683728.1 4'-phosphopantetheinyl transferase superfamily protein [Asticcacaulis aquaticus]